MLDRLVSLGLVRRKHKLLLKIINLHRHILLVKRYFSSGVNIFDKLQEGKQSLKFSVFPRVLDIDLLNVCNFKCSYCYLANMKDEKCYISDETIDAIVGNLKGKKIAKIRLGGGEPTLHPKLLGIIKKLKRVCNFLTITTNCSWEDDSFTEELINQNIDVIEVSIDAGGKEIHVASRKNASYERLLHNLSYLQEIKKKNKSKTIINTRLMMRPSNIDNLAKEITRIWPYVDSYTIQKVTQIKDSNYMEDVFIKKVDINQPCKCYAPFMILQVCPDGSVPICPPRSTCSDLDGRFYLGNVNIDRIEELWNHETLVDLRKAIVNNDKSVLKACSGCNYY